MIKVFFTSCTFLFLTACNLGWKDDDINKIGEEHDLFTLLEYRTLREELTANGRMDELDHLNNRIEDYPDYPARIILIKKSSFGVNDLIVLEIRPNLTASFYVTSVSSTDNGTKVIAKIENADNLTGSLEFTHSGDYKGMKIDYNNESLFLKKHYEVVPAYIEGAEDEYKYYLSLEVPINDV
jgi:hypothetical protein